MDKFGNKTGGRVKGSVNKETVAKKLLQENLWDKVSGKMVGEGIDRCFHELNKLSGEKFVYAYMGLLEYFKPKLQRSTLSNDPDNPIVPPQLYIVPAGANIPLATSEAQIDGNKDPRFSGENTTQG
jgi:hypothetical protein